MSRARIDLFAVTGSALALAMLGVYVALMRQQHDQPAAWVLAAFVVGASAAAYGAFAMVPYRRSSLLVAGLVLAMLGMLAILTIGLPILAAGVLCLVAAARPAQLSVA